MLEKRIWSDVGYTLLGFLACCMILQMIRTPPSSIDLSMDAVYVLYTHNNSGFSYHTHLLGDNDYSKLINLTFNFTIINYTCNESSPLLLVLVHTSPANAAKRRTIRETWGQHNNYVKVLFLTGQVDSFDLQKKLEEENSIYNDFVQGNFLDTYRNITYKHVMAFKYAIYHCPQAKYILKTDDDVFVNMPTMKNFLTLDLSPHGASNVLFCTPRKHSKVLRTYRSKWRVSFTEYNRRNYPTYCPGWTILYSPDVVFALYKEAQKSDYFWIDDVHITGTLTEKINLTHTDIEFLVISVKNLRNIVDYSYNVSRPFLYGRANLKENEIRALWKFVSTHTVPRYILRDVQIE